MFQGSGDVLAEGALGAFFAATQASAGVDPSVGRCDRRRAIGCECLQRARRRPRFVSGVRRTMPTCHQACAFSSASYRPLRGFETVFRIADDHESNPGFFEVGPGPVRVDLTLARDALESMRSRMGHRTAEEYRPFTGHAGGVECSCIGRDAAVDGCSRRCVMRTVPTFDRFLSPPA